MGLLSLSKRQGQLHARPHNPIWENMGTPLPMVPMPPMPHVPHSGSVPASCDPGDGQDLWLAGEQIAGLVGTFSRPYKIKSLGVYSFHMLNIEELRQIRCYTMKIK